MLYNLITLYVEMMISMHSDKFEHELDKFLESDHYDAAEVRSAVICAQRE